MSTCRDGVFAFTIGLVLLGTAAFSCAFAEMTMEVGGAPMDSSKDIIENVSNSKDHTTFVAALKAADLIETLQGEGPFTVFAPVDRAFEKLPKGTIEVLLRPENKPALIAALTHHIIPGRISAADFIAAIKKGGGEATYQTLEGEKLTVRQDERRIEITDAEGNKAIVMVADVVQKNGVMHIVDKVLLPKR
ncbi:MAG TPA: fasciclin domain-containing protein [Methylocella sp.]|nr:fasciclin domain-containing protein [Methylocella sp.]